MLPALNYLAVLIYGVLIMAFLLDIKRDLKHTLLLTAYIILSVLLQLGLSSIFSWKFIEMSYPIVIHFPLLLFFWMVLKQRFSSVLFVLFAAYFLTTPRKWIGEVVSSFFNHDQNVSIVVQIIASVALLVVVYLYLRPYVNRILEHTGAQIILLAVMPALYYVLTYATTVYTDALYRSNVLVVGLLGVGLNFCFYTFVIAYFNEMTKSFAAQTEQTILRMQIDATTMQLEDFKNAQTQAAIYRHDLRHHLHYLSSCIAEKNIDEAQTYINKINSDAEGTQVIRYCENPAVNLLLSAYVAQAKNSDIEIEVYAVVPMAISMHSTDICVILGNSIENAIHACKEVDNISDRKINVSCRHDNGKLMIEVSNPYTGEIPFEGDIPVTAEENHGLGVKSIKAAVRKYQGLYSFTAENGIFTMRVLLQ